VTKIAPPSHTNTHNARNTPCHTTNVEAWWEIASAKDEYDGENVKEVATWHGQYAWWQIMRGLMSMGMSIHAYGEYTQGWGTYGLGLMVACINGLINDKNSYARVEHATTFQV
jgi:hypothetical protein